MKPPSAFEVFSVVISAMAITSFPISLLRIDEDPRGDEAREEHNEKLLDRPVSHDTREKHAEFPQIQAMMRHSAGLGREHRAMGRRQRLIERRGT